MIEREEALDECCCSTRPPDPYIEEVLKIRMASGCIELYAWEVEGLMASLARFQNEKDRMREAMRVCELASGVVG